MASNNKKYNPVDDLISICLNQSSVSGNPELLNAAKSSFIDTIGVMISGTKYSPLPEIESLAETLTGKGSLAKAFHNASAAHVLDMDDYGLYMGHPSAVLIPALLALGEDLHCSGSAVLQAYSSAIEFGYRLGSYCYYRIHTKGWHATSVFMPLVTAFGCATLLGLNESQCHNAILIATSFASGVRGNFGTPVKPIHAGIASLHGLLATTLAASGVIGSDRSLIGEEGFLQLFAGLKQEDMPESEFFIKEIIHPLLYPGLSTKPYPSCSSNHQATLALVDILNENPGITSDDVISIEMGATKKGLSELVAPFAVTGTEARFCPGFHFALLLNRMPIIPENFVTPVVLSPKIQRIIKLTNLIHVPEYDASPSVLPWPAHIELTLRDGTKIKKKRGGERVPLSVDALKNKFLTCSEEILGSVDSSTLFDAINDLETCDDINAITVLLKEALL